MRKAWKTRKSGTFGKNTHPQNTLSIHKYDLQTNRRTDLLTWVGARDNRLRNDFWISILEDTQRRITLLLGQLWTTETG